jgi:hypothetical protein
MASLSLHMCVCLFALHMLGIKVMPHNWHTFIERDLFKGFTSFDSTGSGCFSTKLHTQVRKFLPRCQKYVKKPNLGRCLAAKSLPSHVESIVAVVVASARARARGGAPAQRSARGRSRLSDGKPRFGAAQPQDRPHSADIGQVKRSPPSSTLILIWGKIPPKIERQTFRQGCQIFPGTWYQNRNKMYQMNTKGTKW